MPNPHGFEPLEGSLYLIGLPCTLSLLLNAMQISLAKTTWMGRPEHWLGAGQWWRPAGGHRSWLWGYWTFRWGWLGGWWLGLWGWGCLRYGLLRLELFRLGGSCSLSFLCCSLLGLGHDCWPYIVRYQPPKCQLILRVGNFHKSHLWSPFSTFI